MDSHRKQLADWLKMRRTCRTSLRRLRRGDAGIFGVRARHARRCGGDYADKAIVLRSASALRRATKLSSNFIAVLVSPEVEAASAGLHKTEHTIIVRRRNAVESDPDIELDLVG